MMPVCKYFIRGTCNRGDTCRFDHILPDEDRGRRGGGDYYDSGGTSVLKRDASSSYDSGSTYSDKTTYYNESKNYNVYKKYNDRNVQSHSVTINNDYYNSSPLKQYDTQQFQGSQKYSNDRYHYDPRQNRQQPHQQQPHQQQQVAQKSPEISIDDLYVLFKADIDFIEKGRSWPLTSFSIVKLFGSLDDWFDYSPEELRLAAYLAKANNNFEGYKATLDKIVSQAQAVRDFYKTTSRDASTKLRAYIKQPSATIFPLTNNELDFTRINYSSISLSTSSNEFGNVQPSILSEQQPQSSEDAEMSQSAPKSESGFGSQSSLTTLDFGSVEDIRPSTNIFGGTERVKPSSNIFGGFAQVQEGNQTNVFGNVQWDQSSNVFGSQNDKPVSFLSGQQTQSSSGSFQQSFNIPQGPRDLKTVYPNLNQTDLDVEILSLVWRGDSPYSRQDELTEEEIEQFKASAFTIGKVPLVPPSKEFC